MVVGAHTKEYSMRIRESEKALLRLARAQAVADWHRQIGALSATARQTAARQISEAVKAAGDEAKKRG